VLGGLAVLALVAAATAGGMVDAKGGAKVGLRKTPLGKALVGPNGRALYLFEADKKAHSTCYGACAAAWPPLLTARTPLAGKGVRRGLLGTTKRKNGKLQVTYKGHPLYYFAGDRKAGQTKGQGSGGVWFVVSPAGKKIAQKQPAPSTGGDPAGTPPAAPQPAPPPAPGYGGYGQ
jgi:predicted lipoprotein with Yx(FWY)xxD motif